MLRPWKRSTHRWGESLENDPAGPRASRSILRGLMSCAGFGLLGILAVVLLIMNAFNLLGVDRSESASSGFLTARTTLYNFGAVSDYEGNVVVLPRFFPRIWPFDLWIGCRALDFESDPRVSVSWSGDMLVITHDSFDLPVDVATSCYGRQIVLQQRKRMSAE